MDFKFQMKIHIVDSMKAANSQIRLLLATEACGMGVDIPDVRRVVHITLPSTIESMFTKLSLFHRQTIFMS